LTVATGIFLSVCTASFGIYAEENLPERGLRIATGPANGVYTQLARDIQKVCANVAPLIPVPSKGGLENLMKLSANEADLGFAQIDLMQQMGKDGDQNIRELQAVMSMHSNLLHIITKSEGSKVGSSWNPLASARVIQKFSELKGKDHIGATVVLVGSAQLLGQTLERQVGYGMKFLQADSDEDAVKMLLKDQAEAIFTTGGWPYPPISRISTSSGLMLAEFDLQAPAPFGMVKRNYPNAGAYNMNFLSATNLLLTRPFKPTGERGKMVSALQNCILRHMDEFLEGPYQAAWKEIRNPADTLGVASFVPAPGGATTSPRLSTAATRAPARP
jgi:TRAP-type uncharacterized transport system substrate-binding protein